MSDSDELDLEGGESAETENSGKKKAGLRALLPNLLKIIAIVVAAIILVVTIAVVVFSIMNRGGQSQTAVSDAASPYIGKRPEYQMFSQISVVRTRTKDPTPYSVVVDMVIGYDMNDKTAQTELTTRLVELRDFVRSFFSTKYAADLQPENEARLKQEILEQLNTRLLNSSKARIILFNQLDVSEMQ
jgi:flagellar FliL protein